MVDAMEGLTEVLRLSETLGDLRSFDCNYLARSIVYGDQRNTGNILAWLAFKADEFSARVKMVRALIIKENADG